MTAIQAPRMYRDLSSWGRRSLGRMSMVAGTAVISVMVYLVISEGQHCEPHAPHRLS